MSQMIKVHTFPTKLFYNEQKKKFDKLPLVPKGVSWQTHHVDKSEMNGSKNYGIVVPDGRIIIDLDLQKGVTKEQIEEVLESEIDWENSLVQLTPSGGSHHLFKTPQKVHLRQGNDLFGIVGFDTRCSGRGWVCAGKGYKDESIWGLPEAFELDIWPELPPRALDVLRGGDREQTSIDSDLDLLIAARPIVDDLSTKEAWSYLEKLPKEDLDNYDSWLRVGMALWHQFEGKKEGAVLWDRWSKDSKTYDRQEIKSKWKSFTRHLYPITFATIIQRAGGRKQLNQSDLETILEIAENISTLEGYTKLKERVLKSNLTTLPLDFRAMIAARVAENYGKESNLTKSEIKKSLLPRKTATRIGDPPSWLSPWVYVQAVGEFANTHTRKTISHKAFDASFNREAECLQAEKTAVNYATVTCPIPIVADLMFFPRAEIVFKYQDQLFLNTYRHCGIEPAETLDEDGQNVINVFLNHVNFTLEDPIERNILLDWMSWIIQNPGQRVQWALVLQGAQGTGKSYFVQVLQFILGDLVSNLEPAAIAERFTGWAQGSLVVAIEEIRIHGTSKHQILDRLKPFISNPTIMIEKKGRDHLTIPNFTSYLMLTNHQDAIPLTEGDRRYCVLFSRIQSETELFDALGGKEGVGKYFDDLFGETQRRADALAHFFYNRKISKEFKPFGRAPETKARKRMIESAISPERQTIEDAIIEHACDVVGEDILDMTHLTNLCNMEGVEMPKPRATGAILREMNYEPIEKRRIILSNRKCHYIWIRRGVGENAAKEMIKKFHGENENFDVEDF